MLLYLIRHGDPDYAQDCLTEKGKMQALAVGKRLAQAGIDRIFSSPMGRARETAEPLCRLTGKSYTVLDWAHELTETEVKTPFPDGQPKSVSKVPNVLYRVGQNANLTVPDAFLADGFRETVGLKEKMNWIWQEADSFLETMGYRREDAVYRILRPNEEKIALFCHAAMGRCLISHLLNLPVHTMWAGFKYSHTGVSIFNFENFDLGITAPSCLCYSDLSHIYAERLPMMYDNKIQI